MEIGPERRRKPGRPSKGDRVFTGLRLPRQYRTAAEEIARRDGLDVNDVLTRLVGERLGLPVPDYCYPDSASDAQEELPLKAS
ncbi:hypothetical protein PSU4_54190 [Pseudonocardia sulfidoxydans NBRC 16205]|uniref:Toxin-antitoxin system HicB family antitoxin n=1 Tax=Pseudonocardia sulfidoxydans NBRC 16205 TaxID=1223511 RepID=A0A511DNT7_9PSEU|nr:hypothetical protein [Pseudonocardia sulfidoxydans]GEL26465.1 hypothetical protein PSU4_54190 [Pseudonocardia sulfidoxydans NBRC 16205]